MSVFATIKLTQFKSWLRLEQFPTAKQSQSPAPALQHDRPAAQRARRSPAFWIPHPQKKWNSNKLCAQFSKAVKRDPGQGNFLGGCCYRNMWGIFRESSALSVKHHRRRFTNLPPTATESDAVQSYFKFSTARTTLVRTPTEHTRKEAHF